MTDIFTEFPFASDILSLSAEALAERLLLDLSGSTLDRGKFLDEVESKYPGEAVSQAFAQAWALLVSRGFVVEWRQPERFFVSEAGEVEKKKTRARGLPVPLRRREVAGRWMVVQQLSSGGQGVTSLVHDKESLTQDLFVIKELKSVADEQARRRFATEAKALQKLEHPNILRIIQFDADAKQPWYVSEYCAGGSLEKATLDAFDIGTRLQMFLDVCSALSAAHKAGITHRDLKPENILLRSLSGPAVLGDFGICWLAESNSERLTRANEDIGSSFCRAPELFDGPVDSVAPSADIYCLGKILYWIVIGKGGRSGRLAREEFERNDKDLVAIFSDARYELLNSLLRKMVTEQPAARFRDATQAYDECRDAIDLFLRGYQSINRPPSRCRYCGRGLYKNRVEGRGTAIEVGIVAEWGVYECDLCGHTMFFRKNVLNHRWSRFDPVIADRE
jgi:hypothetical protein